MGPHIFLVGINHKTAPVALRERLSIQGQYLDEALANFGRPNGRGPTLLPEAVILSTCNRLEIYASGPDVETGQQILIDFLSQIRQIPAEEFRDSLYLKEDTEAAAHLVRVTCGLDSMIVGEPQILGQVTSAYQAALAQHASGMTLNTLFQHAIRAGKRAQTETNINQRAISVPSVAASLAEREVGGLPNKVVLVMGAGEMGQIAARTLMKRGASGIIVSNRTYERALALAREYNGQAMTFERQAEALAQADIVITTTDAPHVILTPDKVDAAMNQRPQRPMVIIDIAVPRDTDPAVARIPGVRLFDIDSLQDAVNGNIEARQQEIPHVEDIAAQETQAFLDWHCALDVIPTITQLRQHAEDLKNHELEKALRRLDNLDEREREIVAILAHNLVNKCFHNPTVHLKERAAQGDGHLYASVVRDLFDLEPARCPTSHLNLKESNTS